MTLLMRTPPAGCALSAAHVVKKNRTCTASSTAEISTTVPSEKSPWEQNYWYGMMMPTHNTLVFRWASRTCISMVGRHYIFLMISKLYFQLKLANQLFLVATSNFLHLETILRLDRSKYFGSSLFVGQIGSGCAILTFKQNSAAGQTDLQVDASQRKFAKPRLYTYGLAMGKRIHESMQVNASLLNQNLRTDLRWAAKRIRKSARKVRQVVNFARFQLICHQLGSTCVGRPNSEKLTSTCVRI